MRIIATLLLALAFCTPAAANNGTGTVSFCLRHGCAQSEGPVTPCQPEECPAKDDCTTACAETTEVCTKANESCVGAFLACSTPRIFTRCKDLTAEQYEAKKGKPGVIEYAGNFYKCPVKDHPRRVFVPIDLVQ